MNFYLLEEVGGLTLVDAGTTGDWDVFATAMAGLRRQATDLQAVLVTHAHSDHTGFAERARTTTGAGVWIHQLDATAAGGGAPAKNETGIARYLARPEAYRTLVHLIRHRGMKIAPILQLSAFADGDTIDVPGRPRIVHAPGHTPGMSAVFVESRRVLLTGDALVTRNPLTGRRGPQIMPSGLNRDSQQALRSLDVVAHVPADLVLPGHGEPWEGRVAEAVRMARQRGLS